MERSLQSFLLGPLSLSAFLPKSFLLGSKAGSVWLPGLAFLGGRAEETEKNTQLEDFQALLATGNREHLQRSDEAQAVALLLSTPRMETCIL